jgi:uncharacterized protein YceK
MYPTSRFLRFAIAVAALTLSGCAPVRVHSFATRGTDFTRYHTYAWSNDARSTGDARLDNSPFFFDRVEASVDQQLAQRGYEKNEAAPDLLIHVHASMTEKIDTSGLDRDLATCTAGDCRSYVYEAGTLLLDFVDARTKIVVWRGWAEDSLDGIDSQPLMNHRIANAVAEILEQLPRRL